MRSFDDTHSTTEQECPHRKNTSHADQDDEQDKESESSSGANSGMINACLIDLIVKAKCL